MSFSRIIYSLSTARIHLASMLLGFHSLLSTHLGLQVYLGHVMMKCSTNLLSMEIQLGYLLDLLFIFCNNLLLLGFDYGILQIEIMDGIRRIFLLFFISLFLIHSHTIHLSSHHSELIAFILKSELEKIRDYSWFRF